jgi:uncharacterized membrane protein
MSDTRTRRPVWRRAIRAVRARPRLLLAAIVGLGAFAALPAAWQTTTRLLIGWDIGISLYLVAAAALMAGAEVEHIRRRSAMLDEGRIAILVLTVAAALASLAAIAMELAASRASTPDLVRFGLAALTIVLSWCFVHTMFALHYAHEFYAERRRKTGGLEFPGTDAPDYWDFVYFALVIGMTSQVSDVAVTSKAIRNTVTAHGLVAFVFNIALLSLTVNIAAGAI